jgi:hypothetical protein
MHVCEEGHAWDLYILHVPTFHHTYTHMLGTYAFKFFWDSMLWWSLSDKTLHRGVWRSTPIAFSVRGLTDRPFAFFWFV